MAASSPWRFTAKPSCENSVFAAGQLASPYADWNTGFAHGRAGGTMLYSGAAGLKNTIWLTAARATEEAIARRARTSMIPVTVKTRDRITRLQPRFPLIPREEAGDRRSTI